MASHLFRCTFGCPRTDKRSRLCLCLIRPPLPEPQDRVACSIAGHPHLPPLHTHQGLRRASGVCLERGGCMAVRLHEESIPSLQAESNLSFGQLLCSGQRSLVIAVIPSVGMSRISSLALLIAFLLFDFINFVFISLCFK